MECLVKSGIIHYKTFGAGKPVFIFHSMGTDHRAMEAWLEPVFQERDDWQRVYVYLPAHGHSKINQHFKGNNDAVGSLKELILKVAGEESFSLIGMSYGAYLAQGIMDEMMDRVEGAAFIVPAVHTRTKSLPKKEVIEREDEVVKGLDEDIKKAFETLHVVQTKRMLDLFISEVQPGRELANREFLASNWREKDYFLKREPFLDKESIKVPVLFLLGKQDCITGYEDQFALQDKFSNATFSILDGAGHMLPLEKREIAGCLMKDWMQRVEETRRKEEVK